MPRRRATATPISLEEVDFDDLKAKSDLYVGEPGLDAEVLFFKKGQVRIKPYSPPRWDLVELERTTRVVVGYDEVTSMEWQDVQTGTETVERTRQVLDRYDTETYTETVPVFEDQEVTRTRDVPIYDTRPVTKKRWVKVWDGAAYCDRETGLVWDGEPVDAVDDWPSAPLRCINRIVGGTTGQKGWRLPAIPELASLVDTSSSTCPGLCLPDGHPFKNVKSARYWSASTQAGDPTDVWDVNLSNGDVVATFMGVAARWWCVRGAMQESVY